MRARELRLLPLLADCGVARVHARWPGACVDTARAWLKALPADMRSSMVLHQHHELSAEFQVLGCHVKENQEPPAIQAAASAGGPTRFWSRACHHPEQLVRHCGAYDSLLAAPVFEALSKPGHKPVITDWNLGRFHSLRESRGPRRSHCCALGGVTHQRLEECAQQGFDEAAVLGAVWLATAPVAALRQIISRAKDLT